MTFDQLYQLIQKGYTQEQIKDLYSVFGDGDQIPPPNPNPTPNPDTTPPDPAPNDPTPTPNPENKPQPTDTTPPAESETTKMLKEIIGMMQKGNINGLQNNLPKPESVEDILAKVINP